MPLLMGQMMTLPLMISSALTHAARHAGDTAVVSRRVAGEIHRITYRELERRARRGAQALARLGCEPGGRIGTLAWNDHRHLEIYYAASGSGRVCHTLNPRLHPQQLAWIATDARDVVLLFELNLLPLVEQLAPQLPHVRHYVLLADRSQMPASTTLPDLRCYEALLEAESDDYVWPEFDERAASSLCYTSGTTGDPKGVLYSHRSTMLHSMALCSPNAMGIGASDVILPIVPMFHVNAWGLPYAAPSVGAKLVMPGPHLDGRSLYELIEAEGVTFSAGVPTVWMGLVAFMKAQGLRLSTLRRTLVGGAALPPALMRTLQDDYGIEAAHAWGMTELSPLGTVSRLRAAHAALDGEAQWQLRVKQGVALHGADIEILDDARRPVAWNGADTGNLVTRGHWVVERYYGADDSPLVDLDGVAWFPTGDVATIDAQAFMQITDRSKDVIKSGGEWISSIELENIAMSHPQVHEAAAIARPHPKWDERPLLVVVRTPGSTLDRAAMLAHYDGRIARWQVPDDVVFVDELPHTATGKVHKLVLRERFRDHVMPV